MCRWYFASVSQDGLCRVDIILINFKFGVYHNTLRIALLRALGVTSCSVGSLNHAEDIAPVDRDIYF